MNYCTGQKELYIKWIFIFTVFGTVRIRSRLNSELLITADLGLVKEKVISKKIRTLLTKSLHQDPNSNLLLDLHKTSTDPNRCFLIFLILEHLKKLNEWLLVTNIPTVQCTYNFWSMNFRSSRHPKKIIYCRQEEWF